MQKKNYIVSHIGQDWHKRDCFGCGPDNPEGLDAVFPFDENTGEVRFSYSPKSSHVGAPGLMHGGIIASLLDEAQGVLCFHVGHIVMTDQLQINYHHGVPLKEPFLVRCRITSVRRRRLYTSGIILSQNGTVLAESTARWYVLSVRMIQRMFHGQYSKEELIRLENLREGNLIRSRLIRRNLKKK